MTGDLNNPIFHDEAKAREHFEAIRWPQGPICPHCGAVDRATSIQGATSRPGLYQCNACRQPFSVTVGTVMERSHIPLNKWAAGFHLMASSKKGVSAHQLHRMLGITYKSAWFMAHRIREAMTRDAGAPPTGQGAKTVEIDETYYGTDKAIPRPKRGPKNKLKIVSLVERGGDVRSFHVEEASRVEVTKIMFANVDRNATLMTDESSIYKGVARYVGRHEKVNHEKGEYVSAADPSIHTNTIEGYFSIFKRGMKGVYQHCGKQHLHRYLTEFDFRYSNRAKLGVSDIVRTERAIKGAAGKRLTYNQSRAAQV
jgi:transposase-like protein